MNPAFFTFKVHRGGIFVVDGGTKSYMGGQIRYSHYWDIDKVSLLELDEIAQKLGFTEVIEFYYKVPRNGVFKIIKNDNDILDMVKCIKDAKIDIFLVTPNSTVDGLEDMDIGNWEWDCGTFPESGITLEDYDKAEDDMSDGNYEHFSDSDYDMSEEDDILYSQNVDHNTE
ncbi:hypothetical protein Vadar_034123 [Vaccinium darrowii]|uniref:Uncharacterized protein n=1 Tax=Vaccinium darrowii TaxID=229202 RepID=A0ACB7Y4J8_9ERIC|nr:hypothetical protein Vadar_034123 [Vaccinium darrowii]